MQISLGDGWGVLQAVGVFLLLALVPLLDGADIADDARVGFGFLEVGEFRFCLMARATLRHCFPVHFVGHILCPSLERLPTIMTGYLLHNFFPNKLFV